MSSVPEIRIRRGNEARLHREGDFVLYWMTAFRRLKWNFALQHAADRARELGRPLVILEALRVDYPFASRRLHRFILDGMAERAMALEGSPVLHHPFVEEEKGRGKGLLVALGPRACCVVTDDFPSFFLPRMVEAAGRVLPVALEVVDSNGLLPLEASDRVFTAAYHFRRHLQRTLPEHLVGMPEADPLDPRLPPLRPAPPGLLPREVKERWPRAGKEILSGEPKALDSLPLSSSPGPVAARGTRGAALRALDRFVAQGLTRYAEDRNHPDLEVTSGLSPYLHFGLVSAHEVFAAVAAAEGWTPLRLSDRTDGKREGWWGMGPGAEAFLDQLVTWREVGFNFSSRREDYASWDSLPDWARATLLEHEGDPRPYLYSREELRESRTHDPLWNAAQRQLSREGIIHNYLRMLWGKKILEWSPSPRDALDTMIELNDRYAVDGRDPNSYSGIFWCLGRYDRGWPERAVYGKVRSMTSASTMRKVKLNRYLDKFSSEDV
jgi:deoxyribodipyrimidine photo-lyase